MRVASRGGNHKLVLLFLAVLLFPMFSGHVVVSVKADGITETQLESLKLLKGPEDVPASPLFVGYPYSHVKVVMGLYTLITLPSWHGSLFEMSFFVNSEKVDPGFGLDGEISVWEWYMTNNVDPPNSFEFKVTTIDKVIIMKLIPKNDNNITLSFRIYNPSSWQVSITVRKDASSTEIEVTLTDKQVIYLKADKVAFGASITDSASYVTDWGGVDEITYSGTAEKYVNIGFDETVQIRWSTAVDGYMNDIKSWVGDPSSWDTYENVVATVKQAWLDELNNLPLELDTFDVAFYRVLTAWLSMIVNGTLPQFNGYKYKNYIADSVPFVFMPSNPNTWAYPFQLSAWDVGYASYYLLCLLKPDIAYDLLQGLLALNDYYDQLTSYTNVFEATPDQGMDHVFDANALFLMLAEAMSFEFNFDWASTFSLADTLMTHWRTTYGGGVDENGIFTGGGTPNPLTMELIYFEYILSFIASKAGDTAKRDFYRSFAQNTSLLSMMYDSDHDTFRVPGTSALWQEGETNATRAFWYYSYCSPREVEAIVNFTRYLEDYQYFLDYNNFYNDFQVASPYLLFFHKRPDIAWKNINTLVFPSLDYWIENYKSIWEDFKIPRTTDLYERQGIKGYTSNHAQYILNYLGLYHVPGYPFTFIGIPQASYTIGSLHVKVEGSGNYVDSVTFNGKPWRSLKLPPNVKTLNGELKVTLSDSPNAWKKNPMILPDNGYYTTTNVEYSSKALKFTSWSPVSEQVTVEIYCGSLGKPTVVEGADSWSYDDSTKILTLTVTHHSPATVTVYWGIKSWFDEASALLAQFFILFTLIATIQIIRGVSDWIGGKRKPKDVFGSSLTKTIAWKIIEMALVTAVIVLLLNVVGGMF